MKKVFSILVCLCMLLSLLAACGSDSGTAGETASAAASEPAETASAVEAEPETAEAPAEEAEASEEESAFPVTISHAYGETTIEAKPERVVTLFSGNADAVLALGIVPVGVSTIGYGLVDENGQTSWAAAAFDALGGTVNNFNDTAGIDYEAISDAEPDVIICPNSGITQEQYDALSEIAPTVPYTDMAYAITWEEQTAITAKALGMEAEGQQLIDDTSAYIAEVVAQYPELEGKTAAFCWIDPSNISLVYIYLPMDPRAGFLEELGLSFPEELAAMAETGAYAVALSSENIDMLNCVDIIVCYGEEGTVEALQANDVLMTVPAIANGAVVTISASSELYMGTYVTVLSIPATLDTYAGMLAEAAAKVG